MTFLQKIISNFNRNRMGSIRLKVWKITFDLIAGATEYNPCSGVLTKYLDIHPGDKFFKESSSYTASFAAFKAF